MNKKIIVIVFFLLATGCWLLATGSAAEPVHLEWAPNPFSPDGNGVNDTTTLMTTEQKATLSDLIKILFPENPPKKEEATVSLTIYDLKSRGVRYLIEKQGGEDIDSIIWQGENELGETVPVGLYIWQLKINKKYQLGTVVVVKK